MQNGRVRARRTQEERSATTRRKVIEAAIDCISEEGFRRATTTRVARRAGVTWGAIQHQFGDKDAILQAVMQRGVDELRAEFERVPLDLPLRQRIHVVVERTWDVLNRPFFRAFVEVALATRPGAEQIAGVANLQEKITASLGGLWAELFPKHRNPTSRAMAAQRLAFHALGGAALETLIRPGNPPTPGEIELLEDILYQALPD
ncbi:MAG: TetR/AcrR family transcriptional regulator [Myxococcota bacterium]